MIFKNLRLILGLPFAFLNSKFQVQQGIKNLYK
jgi:hypothetical protein